MKWKSPLDALAWLQGHRALKEWKRTAELGDRVDLSRCLDYLEEQLKENERKR